MRSQRIVRFDSSLSVKPIFQPVFKGGRPKLNVEYSFAGEMWKWRGPEQLGICEQSLLLVLMEIAAEQSRSSSEAFEEALKDAMEASLYEGVAGPRPRTFTLTVSFYELSKRLGLCTGGSAAAQRRAELQRLCEVTVWRQREDGVVFSSRLLAWEVGNNRGVRVILNWRLTEILFGGQFSPICLFERLSLQGECARALHCALSLRIRPGQTRSFHIEKLASYVWTEHLAHGRATSSWKSVDRASLHAVAVRRRGRELLDALAEYATLNTWTVKTTVNGAVQFTRHQLAENEALSLPTPVQQPARRTTSRVSRREPADATASNGAAPRSIWQMFSE
jgi:hypothetical protein